MKLIIAIVQDEDSAKVLNGLMSEGYSATKLATTGGFLKSGNTTLLCGVEENRFDHCIAIIEKMCKSRRQISTTPLTMSTSIDMVAPYPIEVTVGGATIFVLSVEQFFKV